MEALDFIFRIGVVLAVYNFLWWLIMLGFNLLRGNQKKQLLEIYIIKLVRYGFLSNVLFIFTMHRNNGALILSTFIFSGLILLIYLVGRVQSKQEKQSFFTIRGDLNIPGDKRVINQMKPTFDIRFEIGVVILVTLLFIGFYCFPHFAENIISIWFVDTIKGMIAAPIFGFIFKVIGFFFMVSIILKVFNSFLAVISPRENHEENEIDDHFDDYKDVED